jgi:hypothetical protein
VTIHLFLLYLQRLSTKEFPAGLDDFAEEVYKTFKEEVAQILCNIFQRTEKEGG